VIKTLPSLDCEFDWDYEESG